jgi:hypothetical protein
LSVGSHIRPPGTHRFAADGVADLLAIDESRRTVDAGTCAFHKTCTDSEAGKILDELIEQFLTRLMIGCCFCAPKCKRLTLLEFRSVVKGAIEELLSGSGVS